MKSYELKYKISELAKNGRFTEQDASKIAENISAVYTMMEHIGRSDDAGVESACIFALESSKYAFRDVMIEYGCDDPVVFYEEHWIADVVLSVDGTVIRLPLKCLVAACSSAKFYDSGFEFTIQDLIKNCVSKENLIELMQVLEDSGITYWTNDGDVKSTGPLEQDIIFDELYAEIPWAEDVRQFFKAKEDEERTYKILQEVYKKLDVAVFTGVSSCTVDFAGWSIEELEKLQISLRNLEFVVAWDSEGDSGTLFIKAMERNGDYSGDYDEEALQKFLSEPRLGGKYFFVANYCDKVLIPKLLKGVIAEVVHHLKDLKVSDSSIVVKKMKTKTDVYQRLFAQLRAKGFTVTDSRLQYKMGW